MNQIDESAAQEESYEAKATYWARLAGSALREAHEAHQALKAHTEVVDALRAQCAEFERRLAMLRDVATLAVDAKHWDDTFSHNLHVGLLLNNLAPAAVRNHSLKATAAALASFTTADNDDVCDDCDGSGWVTDGDDRQMRCPECGAGA